MPDYINKELKSSYGIVLDTEAIEDDAMELADNQELKEFEKIEREELKGSNSEASLGY